MSERPTIEAKFYGGRPDLPEGEAWVERIQMVQDDQWKWVPPVEITTTEYQTGRVTGRYVRLMATHKWWEAIYIWEPADDPAAPQERRDKEGRE